MFRRFAFVLPQHVVAMETAVRDHSVASKATPALLAKLYKAALDGLVKPVQDLTLCTSCLQDPTATLSTATDKQTGLFVQLSKMGGQSDPYLTLGQKWVMESRNLTVGNTATTFWP